MTKLKKIVFAALVFCSLLPHAAVADRYGIRPGETVWTESGSEGVVEAVFPDGRVSVKIGYSNYTMMRNLLASRGCYRGLCSNQEVITTSGSRGKINGIFPRGTYSVKVGYSNYVFRYEDLGSSNPPPYDPYPPFDPGMQIGETIWTSSGSEGRVDALFPNGDVSVKIGYSNYRMPRSVLAIRGCVGNLCSGYNVVTSSGSRGVINGVFPNSQLSVKIGYSNYTFPYSQLARTRP